MTFVLHDQDIQWCDFFPDGTRFATLSKTHLRLWNAETLRPEAAMELDNLWMVSVGAVFSDGKRICVNGRKDLFFINVERMETEETFIGRDV